MPPSTLYELDPDRVLLDPLARAEAALAELTDLHVSGRDPGDTPLDIRWPQPRQVSPPADLLAALPDPALAVDSDGRLTAWTPAAADRFGWPASAVLGGPPPLFPADTLPAYHRVLAQARNGVRVRDTLLTVIDVHGRRVPAGVSAGPDGFGHVVLVIRPSAAEPPVAVPVPDLTALKDVADVLAAAGATAERLVQRLPAWEPARKAAEQVREAVFKAAALTDRASRPGVVVSRVGRSDLTETPPPPMQPVEGVVLLADPDPADRRAAAAALIAAGYRVLETAAGDEAWHAAKTIRGPMPLLVTELELPKLGGRMLADWLRAARPGLRVLFLSARAPADDLPPGMAFVPKPFTAERLRTAVRRVRAAWV